MNIVLLSHHTETHALTECGDDSVLVNYEKSFIMNETTGARHCIAIGEGRWKMSWPPIRESLRADIELTVIKEEPTSMESYTSASPPPSTLYLTVTDRFVC